MRPVLWCPSNKRVVVMLACTAVVLAAAVAPGAEPPAKTDAATAPAPAAASAPAVEKDAAPAAKGAEAETAAKGAGTEAPGAKKCFRGSLQAGIDAAWTGRDSDVDLNQLLQFQVDPNQCPKLHLRGSLWLNEDLDSDGSLSSSVRDINDTSQSHVQARLMYLYADIDDLWGESKLRIGRQRILEGAAFNRIDGVYFKQQQGAWDWYAFGGVRASVYMDTYRDIVAGGGASYRLSDQTRFALDTYYGQEHRSEGAEVYRGPVARLLHLSFPRRVEDNLDDTVVALSAWHRLTPNVMLFGRVNWHDQGGDELLLDASGYIPCWDVTFDVSYRRQLNSFGDRVSDVTGFYRILGTSNTHDHYFAAVHKPLTKKLVLSIEAEVLDAHGADWETANHDYQRYAAILSAGKICWGLDAQAGVERWNVPGGEGTWAVTGEVTKRWSDWALTLGADYQRYEDRLTKYNPGFQWLDQLRLALIPGMYPGFNPIVYLFDTWKVTLHEDVRSFYLKSRWAIDKDQELNAKVTYELDDSPDSPYWRVQADYTIRF